MSNNNDAEKEHFQFSRLPLRRDRAYQKAQKKLMKKKEKTEQADSQTAGERAEQSAEERKLCDLVDAATTLFQMKYMRSSV